MDKDTFIKDSQENIREAIGYLNEIPILESIQNIESKNINEYEVNIKANTLASQMKFMLEDQAGYVFPSSFKTFVGDSGKKGFFAFYDCAKEWLHSKCEDEEAYSNKLQGLQLDEPYELAKELFVRYVNFRKNAQNGPQYADGSHSQTGFYQPKIRDLFTDDDLAKLGGNEFIEDCLKLVNVKEEEIKKQCIDRAQIKNINSRNGQGLEEKEISKPDLFERVDNHLSWKIFKDGNIKKLTKEEELILQYSMKNEGFWKHLGKSELQILPFTGGVALISGLVAGFAFAAPFATIAFLVAAPLGVGALVIAPIMAPISKKSAIVDNMINISNQNKEFNDNLKQAEEKYKQYKKDHLNFLKAEPEEEKDIKKEENIINTAATNLNDTNEEKKMDPFSIINGVNEQKDKNDKENEEKNKGLE